jgi:predicted  nucleic acid-binding Zn-ribbon protein
VVDTIDFMLGGKGPLRDIPERVGYDRILLAIETLSGDKFTIQRSTNGGAFRVFDGLFSETAPEGDGAELADQHNDRREDNLSAYLLSKVGLSKRRLRRNKQGDTQSLSFRNLARLMIVNEEEIIQQRSPLSDGNVIADTPNISAFKLLLTGVDDSSLVSPTTTRQGDTSREAQVGLLDQLIKGLQHQVKDLAGPPIELEDQLGRLDQSISDQGQQLAISEAQYRGISSKRRELLNKLEEANNRLSEIRNLLDRFTLLDKHYTSDVERLKGIEEAGSLLVAFGDAVCPLCGALPEHHRLKEDCDGNVDAVVASAKAEASKIVLRQGELKQTVATLEKEAKGFERRIPKIEADLRNVSQQIETIVAPNLRRLRTTYGQLADKKGEDGQDDDLRGTDLNTCFYEYLEKTKPDRQFIIVENTDPPLDIQTSSHATKFTGTSTIGRFGFFPKM